MYRRDTKGWLKHIDFMVLDLVVLLLSLMLAYVLRHGFVALYNMKPYYYMAAFLVMWDLVIIFFTEPFRNILKRGYYREMEFILRQALLLELFAMASLYFIQTGEAFSRIVMFLMGVIYVLISYVTRLCWKQILKRWQRTGDRSLLVITSVSMAKNIIGKICDNNYGNYQISGLVLTDGTGEEEIIEGIPVVANLESALDYTQKNWVDEVFVDAKESGAQLSRMIDNFLEMGVTVHVELPQISSVPGKQQIVEKLGSYTVVTTSMNYATTSQAFLKRAMDIAGGLVGCLLCGILFLFVAPAIYIHSPGPVFFAQERIGKNGKRFKMYKFRSMYLDAEERKKELMAQNKIQGGLMFKLDFDPRIIGNRILPDGTQKTGIGQFIRSTSIDEFPQFFNVLKGDMSLVGTRPPLISEFEAYELHHRARMSVKPGITGMWQVSGRSEITDFEEVVRLNTQYINEWTIGLDIKILLQTVLAVIKRKGSV